MAKIKQLPPHEIHKIAAGEVIERPANVIKELVENSLDAGATAITIYVEHGGKSSIRIIDNGVGMSYEDAHMAVVHHATSKLTTIDDLENIKTFGFRGEALSSIASVSSLTLITKEEHNPEGIRLVYKEGTLITEDFVASNQGTDITITNLFSSVPARRKFLKTDETEWRAIQNLMHAFCLSYPECGFTVYHNNKIILQCQPADSLFHRIQALYDYQMVTHFLKSSHAAEDFAFDGIISDPSFMRYDRNSIFIFVNKRWVKNTKLTHSLIKGYQGVLLPARYPMAALFITIDPQQIDINIHPRKEEVHFLHPRRVEQALEEMVKKRLEAYTSQTTAQPFTSPRLSIHVNEFVPIPKQPSILIERESSSSIKHLAEQNNFQAALATIFTSADVAAQKIIPETSEAIIDENYRLAGQLLQTYVLIEQENGLVLVDQHAAHERIMYELFAHKFHEVAINTLLFPEVIPFSEQDLDTLETHQQFLMHYGINFERMASSQCVVTTMPVVLKHETAEHILKHFLANLYEDGTASLDHIHHSLRAQMACKAAIKAGDVLTHEAMKELISTLNKTAHRFSCPHGRPTSWSISRYEIERKFKRKV